MLFSVVSVRSVVSNFSRQVKARGEVAAGYDESSLQGSIQHTCGRGLRTYSEAHCTSPFPSDAVLLVGHFDMLFPPSHRLWQVPLLSARSQLWESINAYSDPVVSISYQLWTSVP